VADLPEGYKQISDEDQKKAEVFFDRARSVADTGNYEYAIEMYLQGLNFDPESTKTHTTVREMGLIRKSRGGKPLGMFDKPKLKKGDDKHNMLAHEKMLAYDPSNVEHMKNFMLAAKNAGCYDTVMWVGGILFNANLQLKKPEYSTFKIIKDTFCAVHRYREASDVMSHMTRMKPADMDLAHEAKNLAANMAMQAGGYGSGGSFRDSVRDKDTQEKLMRQDMDVRSEDQVARLIREMDEDYQKDPADIARFNRLIEALRKSESLEYENRAIEMLEQKYRETKAYKFKKAINEIALAQLSRQERSLREEVTKNPNDADLKKDYQTFLREKFERELEIYRETVANYPTDTTARYEMGVRMFKLKRYDESIEVFQQVRMDPKYRMSATILLGQAFLAAGFVDEAVDTLQEAIAGYQVRGDDKSIEIHYYCAIALEQKGDIAAALKLYSQVAQWKFTYRDVQQRIKRLRGGGQPTPTPLTPAT
jgi:tetratricopeptide (TPR) repeat protein